MLIFNKKNIILKGFKNVWKYLSKREKTFIEWVTFICTVLGGIAVVISFIPEKINTTPPFTLNYPPVNETGLQSLTFGEQTLNEVHLSWLHPNSPYVKSRRNCFRFEFSIKNTSNILQSGTLHLSFHNPEPIHKYSSADENVKSLLCDNPLNKFIFNDPFDRTELKRTIFEASNDLVVNYKYKNMPPNKDLKLHFYLNYNPNTILEITEKGMEVIARPITLKTELTSNTKVYNLGSANIYMHVNTGTASMITALEAYSNYFLSLSLKDNDLFKRINLYFQSLFTDIKHEVNRLVLMPRFYLKLTYKDKKYFLATTEGNPTKEPAWNILKFVNTYNHNSVISSPKPMSIESFSKLKEKLISTILTKENIKMNWYQVGDLVLPDDFEKKEAK